MIIYHLTGRDTVKKYAAVVPAPQGMPHRHAVLDVQILVRRVCISIYKLTVINVDGEHQVSWKEQE